MNAALNFNADKLLKHDSGCHFNCNLYGLRNNEKAYIPQKAMQKVGEDGEIEDIDDFEDIDDDEDGDDDADDIPNCHCGRSCKQPNELMADKLKLYKEIFKDKTKASRHFLREDYVYSKKLEDYLVQSVYVFDPVKMMGGSKKLVCWSKGCMGHQGNEYFYDIKYCIIDTYC